MPDGFDLLAELRAAYPALPVVVVSASDRSSDVIRAIDLGAMGFVPKRASNETLFEALQHGDVGRHLRAADDRCARTSRPGRAPTPAAGTAEACGSTTRPRQPAARASPPLAALGLTPRQTDVLALLLQGQPNKLIARALNLSVETVKDHVAAVLRTLNVSSRTQAVLAVSQMSQPGRLAAWRESRQADAAARMTTAARTPLPPSPPARRRRRATPRRGADRARAPASRSCREEVQSAFEYMPATLAGMVAGAGVVSLLFWDLAPRHVLLCLARRVRGALGSSVSAMLRALPAGDARRRSRVDRLAPHLERRDAGLGRAVGPGGAGSSTAHGSATPADRR